MRQRELRGRPSFSKACKRDCPSKCASITGVCSTEITRSGKNFCYLRVCRCSPLALTHELIVWSHFCREEDYACVLGLKGDARAPRKILERDGGKLQPPTTR